MDWVTISKIADLSGYTVKAIERKIEKGELAEGIHWIKAPDGRRLVSIRRFEQWATGGQVSRG